MPLKLSCRTSQKNTQYGVRLIKKYLNMCKYLNGGGYKVIFSHIDDGKDFFTYEPDEHYDCIISNPPYSKKDAVYKRLFQLKKPWAMLVGMNGLFDSKFRFGLFSYYGIQILVPDGRTKFINKDNNELVSPPFQAIYLCWNLLTNTIMYEQSSNDLF